MMLGFFVVCLIAVPVLSAIFIAALGKTAAVARQMALASVLLTLLMTVVVCWDFAAPRFDVPDEQIVAVEQFTPKVESATKFELIHLGSETSINFHIGLDGLNVWLVALTSFLMVPAVLVSWKSIEERPNEYYAWLLVLQAAMVGVFLAFDVVLFYVFFELTLIPLFFLIGIWGGSQRQYAAKKFFIFTLTGSLVTLVGVLGVVLVQPQILEPETLSEKTGPTFSIPELASRTEKINAQLPKAKADAETALANTKANDPGLAARTKNLEDADERMAFWKRAQFWLFLAMMVGFAIKVPIFPVHTWLPLAHTEAPTAGSVLLAGVLLKLGTYGFMRLCLPLVPDACATVGATWLGWLAVIGIIYGALCALRQDDVKKLVAYSSVSHLGFCVLGLFALNESGITGSLLQMINHGLSTGALFLLVGFLYERYHTRKLADYSGMASKLKILSAFMVFITMSSVGLPGLNGFIGEVLVLAGMYGTSASTLGPLLASLGATGVVLGAWYMLTMVRKVFFGELKEPPHHGHAVKDLDGRELAAIVPIAVLCLVIGLIPMPLMKTAAPEVKYIVKLNKQAEPVKPVVAQKP